MNFTEYAALRVADIRAGLLKGDFTAHELAQAAGDAYQVMDGPLHAFLQPTPGLAQARAEALDQRIAGQSCDAANRRQKGSGTLAPTGQARFTDTVSTGNAFGAHTNHSLLPNNADLRLAGVPIAFKDNMNQLGTRTTCASRMLENYESTYTATCVDRALAAGALPLGKLNMDEFAFGSSTESSAFGTTQNPWDLSRVPGGSSGGSAAAVASGITTVALGSDTGGSIRQPAAFCGVVGFKPTYGVVSRYGVVAFGSSLDQVGAFGRSVGCVAAATDAICGRDVRDCTSQDSAANFEAAALAGVEQGIKGMKIGVVREYLSLSGLEAEVIRALEDAIGHLECLGAHIQEVELPNARAALSAYYVIGPCEAFSNLSRFDSVRYGYRQCGANNLNEQCERSRAAGFGPETIRRVMLGSYLLSSGVYHTYYYPAQQVRTLITQDYQRAFASVDALLTPVSPRTAFSFGEITDPTQMYLSDVFTIPINIAGNGGLSLPVGLGSDSGLPVAVQLIGPQFQDENILRVAAALEARYDIERLAPLYQRLLEAKGEDAYRVVNKRQNANERQRVDEKGMQSNNNERCCPAGQQHLAANNPDPENERGRAKDS
ncbi:MAG: Asp-tRNA(Asn)/Glu-tRNA(Gln) amidotransferase subunit GatA [Coriobacteriales bacterium]|nr:Asp-tRNA(Asn)/Glu-tRNA(Gln) amidotransferase subunit GatA [Coriobacteriales bacterium]